MPASPVLMELFKLPNNDLCFLKTDESQAGKSCDTHVLFFVSTEQTTLHYSLRLYQDIVSLPDVDEMSGIIIQQLWSERPRIRQGDREPAMRWKMRQGNPRTRLSGPGRCDSCYSGHRVRNFSIGAFTGPPFCNLRIKNHYVF